MMDPQNDRPNFIDVTSDTPENDEQQFKVVDELPPSSNLQETWAKLDKYWDITGHIAPKSGTATVFRQDLNVTSLCKALEELGKCLAATGVAICGSVFKGLATRLFSSDSLSIASFARHGKGTWWDIIEWQYATGKQVKHRKLWLNRQRALRRANRLGTS